MKEEVGEYAHSNKTQAGINRFKSKYPQCTFLRTSINNWKRKFNNQREDSLPPIFNKRGRPNPVRDYLLQKTKEVVSIGNGALKANDPNTA